MADAAEAAPLLLVVEDTQWLDRPTADVLGLWRGVWCQSRSCWLFAFADGLASPVDVAALAELHLEALGEQAAGALLDEHHPELAPAMRWR